MLLADNEKVVPLLQSIDQNQIKIHLYKRNMGEYCSWIICAEASNLQSLKKNWNLVVDNAALHFQAELELAVERYNLYIVFFINDEVPNTLKTLIEQDKYSSRKIVVNEHMPELIDELNFKIEKLLFSINLVDIPQNYNNNILEEWIKEEDSGLYSLFLKYGDKLKISDDVVEEYISFFTEVKEGE